MVPVTAYVLVKTAAGKALSAAGAIRQMAGVRSAHAVTGVYDAICLVEAEDLEQLAAAVVNRIQGVEGVERTETAVVVHTG